MTPLPPAQVEPHPWRGLLWLSRRECHRVLKLWKQTILAPVISALLFMVVFGLSLGNSITEINGFAYKVYIVPDLIAMAKSAWTLLPGHDKIDEGLASIRGLLDGVPTDGALILATATLVVLS